MPDGQGRGAERPRSLFSARLTRRPGCSATPCRRRGLPPCPLKAEGRSAASSRGPAARRPPGALSVEKGFSSQRSVLQPWPSCEDPRAGMLRAMCLAGARRPASSHSLRAQGPARLLHRVLPEGPARASAGKHRGRLPPQAAYVSSVILRMRARTMAR